MRRKSRFWQLGSSGDVVAPVGNYVGILKILLGLPACSTLDLLQTVTAQGKPAFRGITMTQLDLAPPADAIWPGFVRREAQPIRLVLIDDHPVVREGISAVLGLESDMIMVGDAGDMDTGIELVRRHKPDLVICDLTMPGCTGTIAVRKLCRECPTMRVLVLSAQDSLECIRESFAAGAIGYVRKDALRADLLGAVRRAAAGAQAICLGVSDMLMRNWLLEGGAAAAPTVNAPLEPE